VVGAGIAGLTAAYRLANLGADVTVLEASERVGGRMTTDRRDGYLIDRGAQFLSDGYSVICDLTRELGLGQHLARASGWTGIVRGGAVRRINGGYPWTIATSGLLSWRDTFRVASASLSLVRATRRLPLNDYSKWHMLDDANAAEWIAASFGTDALEYVFEPMLEGFYFQAPEAMSRAWPAVVWSFGARRTHATALVGGIESLPEALAQKVEVRLASPAEAIDTAGSGVSVQTPAGTLRADHLVLATTASVARQLHTPESEVEHRLLRTNYSAAMNISFAVPEGVSTAKVPKDIYGLLIPRLERQVIAAVSVESRKSQRYVPHGELLNVMLDGSAASRLMQAPEGQVLAEVLPELQRYFPGIDRGIGFTHFSRWAQAEPRSPVGRSRDLQQYRQLWHPGMKVILAGDYMSIPCAEGAAESGNWAATAQFERTVRRGRNS
jgi:oxygen-dependent protoporphyrinogen oxidase